MNPDIAKYPEDIRLSIEAIEYHLQHVSSLAAYTDNLTVMDAVERRLAIIGEALFRADKMDKLIAITDKPKIICIATCFSA